MSDWQDWLFGAIVIALVGALLVMCGVSIRNDQHCRTKNCPTGMQPRMVDGAGCACLTVPK